MCKQAVTQAQNLCQACGLCCDGTIFDNVGLGIQDSPQPLQLTGITLLNRDTEPYFHLPCSAHKNKSCSIYEQRPHSCQTYQCKLLRQFESQEITWSEATTIVAETVQQRDELISQMRSITEIPPNISLLQMTRIFDESQRKIYGDSVVKQYPRIFLQIAAMQIRVKKFFRKKAVGNSDSELST